MRKCLTNHKLVFVIVLSLSIALNIVFSVHYGPSILSHIMNSGGEWNENPQWNAYVSMFHLNQNEADIVFLGDSITARGRWEEFFPDTSVLNRGIGSDTSEGVLQRMDEVISRKPKKIFLMIGCNDLGYDIPVREIVSNVKSIIEYCNTNIPDVRIYLQSVLPQNEDGLEVKVINELNILYEDICQDYNNVQYIDLYKLFLREDGSVNCDYLSRDGVHLNGFGYKCWIDAIKNFVEI